MNIQDLKNLLRSHNLKPNFTYGQNFLVDDEVLNHIVDSAEVSSEDFVVEIGPGIGNLTKLLCEKAGFVLSIEKDPKFQPLLYAIKKDHRDNFRYEITDALAFNYDAFFSGVILSPSASEGEESTPGRDPSVRSVDAKTDLRMTPFGSYKVVANIPYYITGKILQMFLTAKNKPSSITVLTQKEVAENVTAEVGDLSVLAISVQLFGEPKIVRKVLAESFYPAPKVDSAILHIELFKKPKYKIENEKKFFKVVKACFAGKRKQLHNTLVNNLRLEKEQVEEILNELKIPATVRPQELSIDQWVELTNKI